MTVDVHDSHCYHCGLPLPKEGVLYATVLGERRAMCCPGCQAVAESIVNNGLEDYYRYRTVTADKGDSALEETLRTLEDYDSHTLQQAFVVDHGQEKHIQLSVEGIHCAACGWLIEKRLTTLNGLVRVAVNVTARRATIVWQDDRLKLSQILREMERIGYHALPFEEDAHEQAYAQQSKVYLRKIGLSGLLCMQVMMIAIGLYFGVFGYIEPQTKSFLHWVSLGLTLPVVAYAGFGFYQSAIKGLKTRTLNMDLSISVAILGTFISSAYATVEDSGDVYFESVCMFIFLLLVSRYIEHRTRHKAAQIASNIESHIPSTASKLEGGKITQCLAANLLVSDEILVKSGEFIPVDGTVIQGSAEIDESMLSGEFSPLLKQPGDQVFGGTLNTLGSINVKVTQPLSQSLVKQLSHMQELALASKPEIARFADRSTQWFVFAVLLLAALSFAVWQFIDPNRSFWVAIAVLVATCPCALGLATPSALVSGLANLKKQGVLVKHADALEQAALADTIVFDKTGTLTQGQFSVQSVSLLSQSMTEQSVLQLAALLESHSEHPLSKAFTAITDGREATDISIHPGFGVQATVDGVQYRIGSWRFMQNTQVDRQTEYDVYLESEQELLAAFALSDQISPSSQTVVDSLRHKHLMILSGDHTASVAKVADSLGIEQFEGNCTPQRKLEVVQNLQSRGKRILMIGDGINDAPVLAAANTSLTVGGAADISKRSADFVLLGKGLGQMTCVFPLAERVMRTIRQNMLWAFGYNLVVLPLAVTGLLTPWMAVIGMSTSAIIVVLNSTRLLR